MIEHSSIVLPIQFEDKKGWNQFGDFRRDIFSVLEKGSKANPRFSWKSICYFDKDDKKNECKKPNQLSIEEAFEMDEDKLNAEKEYFYQEVFETFYDKNNSASCFYMLTYDGNVLLEKSKISLRFGNTERKIRKMYLYLTNTKIGLLIIELESLESTDILLNSQIMDQELIVQIESNPEGMILDWISAKEWKEGICYTLPYHRKYFVASYVLDDADTSCLEDNELKYENISREAYALRGQGNEKGMISFFSHYFQIYWLCILQKMEVLHISRMAGNISREKKAGKMYSRILKVSREYNLFTNQYVLAQCTYHAGGEKLYCQLRDEMSIERNNAYLNEQVRTLCDYAEVKARRITNWLLGMLPIVSIILALIDLYLNYIY